MGETGRDSEEGPRPGLLVAAGAFILLAAVGIAFSGALDNGFVNFDDDRYITENPRVRSLTAESLRWMLTDTATFYWHPLTWLWHAAEVRLFGLDARWHHATSLLLHAVNAFLLFLLLPALARAAGSAAAPSDLAAAGIAAALLWALHPLRVESVAWASEKKDLLSTIFLLLVLHAWLRYGSAAEGAPRGRWYAAALGALALSLLAKPMAMTVPVLLLVLDGWPLRRFARPGAWRGLLLEKIPFVLLAAAAVLPSALDPRQDELLPTGAAEGIGPRLVATLWGFAFGVVKTAWPFDLVPFYPLAYREDLSLANPKYALSALLLAGVTAGAVVLWRRGRPAALAAWLFYLAATLPVSGLRQAGSVETADRFAYLPTAALFLLLGGALVAWIGRAGSSALPLAAVLALAAGLGILSRRQVEVWRDGETLWTRVAEAFPGRVLIAHNNLGALHHVRGLRERDPALLDRAAEEYRTALRLDPTHQSSLNNLGLILLEKGDLEGAERLLLETLRLRPDMALAQANLARVYARQGRTAEALERIRLARAGKGPAPPFLDELELSLRSSPPPQGPRRAPR